MLDAFNIGEKFAISLTQQYQASSSKTHPFERFQEMHIVVPANKTLWQWVYTAKNIAGDLQILSTLWFAETDG